MSIKRVVDTKFLEDEKVMNEFSSEDKLFFLYLLTNPHTKQIGIYKINSRQMAFEIGVSIKLIRALLDRFQNQYGLIRYNSRTAELAVKSYLRHSIVKGGKPVLDLLIREAQEIEDRSLLEYIKASVAGKARNETVKHFLEKYVSPSPAPSSLNENENENENEESYHDSYCDSTRESTPAPSAGKAGTVKTRHGTFRNVLLTGEQLGKLEAAYQDSAARIDRLSEYIESKGVRYKSHYATLLAWARKDIKDRKEPAERS